MDSTTANSGALTALVNIANAFPAISAFITALFGLIGVVMIANALKGFYEIEAGGPAARDHHSHGALVWKLFIGAVLTMGAWGIGIIGNTIFGSQVASGPMSYQGAGLSATQQAAVQAVFACFVLCGYIAFGRGWMLLNDWKSGRSNGGWGTPVVFIVSGVLLVYLQQVLNFAGDVTGINFVNMLVF
ncbi:hypothetical protein [Burkholderia vietnamiensis]|jgi:hypothetical protein|uniref:hypothetical protein n=1 Tax=Burkholderia cepacia complex TaxID=87882 RepID=UPI00158D213B|nr:hypothetical protein [Burkholderia vietnamiensis]MCA8197371.1 hypothetical protein [Burkholderia vietnamiensis]